MNGTFVDFVSHSALFGYFCSDLFLVYFYSDIVFLWFVVVVCAVSSLLLIFKKLFACFIKREKERDWK